MRIAEAAFGWGSEVSLTSKKHRNGTDRIAEVANKISDTAYIINVQGDEPLIDPKLIDRMTAAMQRDPKLEMITAAHPFENAADAQSPHQVKVVCDLAGRALYFSRTAIPYSRSGGLPAADKTGRSGARPSLILRHQGIYGYTRDLLLRFVKWQPSPLERVESLEQLRALENGVKISVLLTSQGSPGVDTPADAEAIERLLSVRSNARRSKRRL
jgi:3-deoxy-manno-octulosonate cytidylyltransferase (CMP-KDO synthetase)